MKRLFRSAIAALTVVAFAGCATQGQPVDYASLVTNTCNLATTEVATLQALQSSFPVADQQAFANIAPVITQTCAAVSTNPQDTYAILATVMVALTTLYVRYHTAPPAAVHAVYTIPGVM